jgi:hypothetical protein
MRHDQNGKYACQHDPSLEDPRMLMYARDDLTITLTLGIYGVITEIKIESKRILHIFGIDDKRNRCISPYVPDIVGPRSNMYFLNIDGLYLELECFKNRGMGYWNILIKDPFVENSSGFCKTGLIPEMGNDKMSPCNNVLNYILKNYYKLRCNNFEICKKMWCRLYSTDYKTCVNFVSANQMNNFLQTVCALSLKRDPITCIKECKTCVENLQDFPYSAKEILTVNETVVYCKNLTGTLRIQEFNIDSWVTKFDLVVNNYQPYIFDTDKVESDFFRLQQCFPVDYNQCEGTMTHHINYSPQ